MGAAAAPGGARTFALAMFAVSLALGLPPATAWLLDAAGVSLRTGNLAAALAVQALASFWLLRGQFRGISGDGARLIGAAATFALVAAVTTWFAWPTLLPVAISDATLHWLLADYIWRHSALPRGWHELEHLGELTKTPFGASFLVAALARATGSEPLAWLHVVAALLVGAQAVFAYAVASELLPGLRWRTIVVVPLFLWAGDYTLGQVTRDFFLPQTYAMACLLGFWYWVVRYRGQADRVGLLGMASLGVGALFSYPTLVAPFVLGFAWVARHQWRHLLVVALPMTIVALGYLAAPDRREVAGQILRQGGITVSPGLDVLPLGLVLLGLVGLRRSALVVWLTLVQSGALFAISRVSEAVAPYHFDKVWFLLASQLAICAAVVVARWPAAGLAVCVVAAWHWSTRLPHFAPLTGERAPLRPDQVAVARWVRAELDGQPIQVLGPDDTTGYWLEIGLLFHERATWRTRRSAPVSAEGYRLWRTDPAAPSLLLVPSRAGELVTGEEDVLLRVGEAAVVRKR